MTAAAALELAIIGAGPTASSLLERLLANVPELLDDRSLRVHLVDPYRAGTGRVWRPDLHPLLWMNSMAEDVTMFTDDSVRCDGPIRPGPSLYEWARQIDPGELATLAPPELATEIASLSGMTFPTRRVQSVYLDWFHRRAVAARPVGVEVVEHPCRAVDICDANDGQQMVELDDGRRLVVDVVVLALGHLDATPGPRGQAMTRFADANGLAYVSPGHTAEQDLSVLRPGSHVLALGFGQAFTDLIILLTEGRGGRFEDDGDGRLRYRPSGREPVVHVGSRRGVPYRSKLDYRLLGPPPPLPRFLDEAGIALLPDRLLDFRRDVLPVVVKEVGWAYYHELFAAHPERTTTPWSSFAERYAAEDVDLDRLVEQSVPDPADRLDLLSLDRPLTGRRFGSADALHDAVVRHVTDDVARRTNPTHSADLGAFVGLLSSFGVLARIAGRLTERSRVEDLNGWWFSFFMYVASGPPPERLQQCLALADAGLLRFLGADTTIVAEEGRFVARSSSHQDAVVGDAFVDARIALPSVGRTRDVLVRRLRDRGEVIEEVVVDGGWSATTGKVVVTGADLRLVQRDGRPHDRRHAVGVFTNRPAAGAFARPRTNAPAFRQNDAVARSILTTLAAVRPVGTVVGSVAS